jgi:hypothetical protein
VLVAAQTDILDRWKRSDRTYRFLPSPFPLRRGDKTRQRGTASRSSKTHKFFSPPRISIFAFSSDPNRKILKKSLRRGHRIRTFTFLSPQEILLCIFIIIGVVGPNRKYEGHLKVRHLIRRECNHSSFFNMNISKLPYTPKCVSFFVTLKVAVNCSSEVVVCSPRKIF